MDKKFEKDDEYVVAGPALPNGNTLALHHTKENQYIIGEITHQVDGKSLPDKTLLLESNPGTPYFNILGTVGEMKKLASGPAMVTSDAYRSGWDNVFGNRQTVGQA
jgi:hypothetical protein